MALLDALFPTFAADVVAVFDNSFNQVFTNARPVKAMIREASRVMEHPVETGATITDHRVIEPIEIELSLVLSSADYRSVYQQIREVFFAATLLSVQTRTSIYSNMLISEMPHDEDADLFDAVSIALKLKEVLFVAAQYGNLPASSVADKSQASTTQRGELQSTDAGDATTSTDSLLYQEYFK